MYAENIQRFFNSMPKGFQVGVCSLVQRVGLKRPFEILDRIIFQSSAVPEDAS